MLQGSLVLVFAAIMGSASGILSIAAKPVSAGRSELLTLLILGSGALLGLDGWSLGSIRLSYVAGGWLVCAAAWALGPAAAAGLGTAVGWVLASAGPVGSAASVPPIAALSGPLQISCFAVPGLAAGLLRSKQKAGVAGGYLIGVLWVAGGLVSREAFSALTLHAVVSVALFAATSQRTLAEVAAIVPGTPEAAKAIAHRRRRADWALRQRLHEVSDVFRELGRAFRPEIGVGERGEVDMSRFVRSVHGKLCKGCTYYRKCWEEAFHHTYWDMVECAAVAERRVIEAGDNGPPDRASFRAADLPEGLARRCIQPSQLTATIQQSLSVIDTGETWRRQTAEAADLVGTQLQGLARIVEGVGDHVAVDVENVPELEERLARAFAQFRLPVVAIAAVMHPSGRIAVSLTLSAVDFDEPAMDWVYERRKPTGWSSMAYDGLEHDDPAPFGGAEAAEFGIGQFHQIPPQRIRSLADRAAAVIGAEVGTPYVLWESAPLDGGRLGPWWVRFMPEPTYDVEMEMIGRAKPGQPVCGDAHSTMRMADGRMAIILSDGMGAGPKAAVESQAAVSLLERMLHAGFDRAFAVRTINSTLLLRSPQERFATIDLAIIDVYKGEVEFVKIGSCPSYMKRARGRDVDVVRSESLPVGILSSVEVEPRTYRLSHGDLLIMVTDGVLDARKTLSNKEGWIYQALRRLETNDPRKIAEQLLAKCVLPGESGPSDDCTVVVARLIKKSERPHTWIDPDDLPAYREESM